MIFDLTQNLIERKIKDRIAAEISHELIDFSLSGFIKSVAKEVVNIEESAFTLSSSNINFCEKSNCIYTNNSNNIQIDGSVEFRGPITISSPIHVPENWTLTCNKNENSTLMVGFNNFGLTNSEKTITYNI